MASSATIFDTDCKLMFHADGTDGSTTFVDSSESGHTLTAVGDAQLDTAIKKFGTASSLYDGTGDRIAITGSLSDFDVGTDDFTLDFWAYFNETNTNEGLFGATNLICRVSDSNQLYTTIGGTDKIFSWTRSSGQWYHIALTRSGTDLEAFVDGTSLGTLTSSDSVGSTATVVLGDVPATGQPFNGQIDELRFIDGLAVWTGNFTPPTQAYVSPAQKRQQGAMLQVL